ncbi:MAG: hypothetical protein HFG02_01040 [Oscillibacter sp.]|nr:hypothetical protein [Oscillibacter sp.]
MLFTLSGFYAVCGLLSLLGAAAGPFLLYRLIAKATERRPAAAECAALSVFGLAFCLWLLTAFGTLPAA